MADLGDTFMTALGIDPVDTFLGALGLDEDDQADGEQQGDTAPEPYDLDAGLKEEAALSAWKRRVDARYKQVRERNRRALVVLERTAAGRTYTPAVDGVKIGTVTLKGKSRAVVVKDPAVFARWVAVNFPSECALSVDLGTVDDPVGLVDWINTRPDAPVVAAITREVRAAFRTKVLGSLNDSVTTTLTWNADKTTGEVRTLDVAGVEVVDVPEDDRVHQIAFDKKHGGEDAAAAYFEGRGLDALTPGAEDTPGA
ncbi:hypothetical protein [Streptomyces sp. NPDC088739]|uniref:hypothetical protein n=1 Tax=Streptomyces sp. NPDC088739 TaxID=3365882 RepID=UPI0037F762E6